MSPVWAGRFFIAGSAWKFLTPLSYFSVFAFHFICCSSTFPGRPVWEKDSSMIKEPGLFLNQGTFCKHNNPHPPLCKKHIKDGRAVYTRNLLDLHVDLTWWEFCRNPNLRVMSLWWRIQRPATFITELIRAVPTVWKSFFLDKWYISFFPHDLLALFQYCVLGWIY